MHAEAMPDADPATLADPARRGPAAGGADPGQRARRRPRGPTVKARRRRRCCSDGPGGRPRPGRPAGRRPCPARRAICPTQRDGARLLVIDPAGGRFAERRAAELPGLLRARGPGGGERRRHPARLAGRPGRPGRADRAAPDRRPAGGRRRRADFQAVLFGAGDWRQRTEDRPAPARVRPGDRLRFGGRPELAARRCGRCRRCRRGWWRCASIARARRCGRRSTAWGGWCSTPTWPGRCRCGRCRTCTPAGPGRSRCPRPGGTLSWQLLLDAAPPGRRAGQPDPRRGAERDRRSAAGRAPAAARGVRAARGDGGRDPADPPERRAGGGGRHHRGARAGGRPPAARGPAAGPRRDRSAHRPRHPPGGGGRAGVRTARAGREPLRPAVGVRRRQRCWPRPPASPGSAGFRSHELGDVTLCSRARCSA